MADKIRISRKIRLSALDLILTESDKLKYARAISRYKHLLYFFKTVEPRLISYYHLMPSLFDPKTAEGIAFREALDEFLDKGDADALAIYLKYYKAYIDARLEDLPLSLKTDVASELTGKSVQYKIKDKGNWKSPDFYLGENNDD